MTWPRFGKNGWNDIQDSQKEDGDIPFVSPLHWRDGINAYQMWAMLEEYLSAARLVFVSVLWRQTGPRRTLCESGKAGRFR